jgi:hypothetical protein
LVDLPPKTTSRRSARGFYLHLPYSDPNGMSQKQPASQLRLEEQRLCRLHDKSSPVALLGISVGGMKSLEPYNAASPLVDVNLYVGEEERSAAGISSAYAMQQVLQ